MIDPASLAEGLAIFKSGMEGIRLAFQLARDVKGLVPAEKRVEVDNALALSEKQFAYAEAQIAKGLGFELCRCANPPTPMLTVGWLNGRRADMGGRAVHRCPKCGIIDNSGWSWTPTSSFPENVEAPPPAQSEKF